MLTPKYLGALLALCVLALPSVRLSAEVPARGAAAADAKASTGKADVGLVWRIEGGTSPVYLAGSFHLLRKKDLPLPPAYDEAYAATRQLWMEVPPGEMEKPATAMKLLRLGMLPADQSLEEVIDAAAYEKVEAWAEKNPGMSANIDRMRPWLVALTIALTEYQKIGADPQHGVEKLYSAKAKKDGKTTGGFESVEQQLGFFAEMTEAQQKELLAQTFTELAESRQKLKDMIQAWRAGDTESLSALLTESFKGYEDIQKKLLDDRNARWIEPIEKLLNGSEATLVIVGAGHLCGPGSVNDLLEKKGWKLSRVGARP